MSFGPKDFLKNYLTLQSVVYDRAVLVIINHKSKKDGLCCVTSMVINATFFQQYTSYTGIVAIEEGQEIQ